MIDKLIQLPTAGLLFIRNKKLLLAFSKNKQCYYLPGGKIDEGESPALALCREIKEELNIEIAESDLHYYTHITAPAFGEEKGVIMEQECFLLYKDVDPIASAEIGEIKYFSVHEYLAQDRTAPGAVMILEKLKANGLID